MSDRPPGNAPGDAFHFDPRTLISPPHIACPQCGQSTFGILSIHGTNYMRRCNRRECWHTQMFPLWPIEKQVIYIDQFAISNMMKMLNPKATGHERASMQPFWLKLFQALSRVCQLQLAICPDSNEHRSESLVHSEYESLKRMYELLSHGVSFIRADEIERFQHTELARRWINGEPLGCTLDPATVTTPGLHDWQGKFYVTVNMDYSDIVEKLRAAREERAAELQALFEFYQRERKSYAEWLAHEQSFCGRIELDRFREWGASIQAIQSGQAPIDPSVFEPSHSVMLVTALIREFEAVVKSPDGAVRKVVEFLRSDVPQQAPANLITCSMYASLALKASAGQKQPPNRGTVNDISMIASLMPYCDAMLIDNGSRALLDDIPKSHKLPYKARIFSFNTRNDFLDYLTGLERNASPEHMKLVEGLYGPDWGEP